MDLSTARTRSYLSSGVPEPRSYLNRVCACGLPRDLRSAARRAGSAKMSPVKRSERWARDSDGATSNRKSSAGPLRRRRAQRHLDSLAQHPARELSPTAAVAHVRVLGEPVGEAPNGSANGSPAAASRVTTDTGREDRDDDVRHVREPESLAISAPSGGDVRIVSHQLGVQLRPVPIDEPLASFL